MNKDEKHWRAYYVKPRHEKKAAERLQDDGFEIYCPLVETKVKWSDRWKKVTKPLVPGYIFVLVNEHERVEVLEDPGVLNCVHWLGRPAVIREDEIEAMKLLLDSGRNIKVEPFERGDKVEVEKGVLRGRHGIIIHSNETEASLQLDTLNCQITVTLPAAALKMLAEK